MWYRIPLILALLAPCALAQPGVWPDPGFEQTGAAGLAHSGERAGTLEIGARSHWLPMGGAFAVEPYATYRVRAWARGSCAEGALLALYYYEWDSYVWAFGGNVPVTSPEEWQEVSVTLRSPRATIYLHPLAFMDASGGKGWIDDIQVERLSGPEETIRAIERAADPSGDDLRLLVRWRTEHGDLDAAEALLERTGDPGVRADIACVVAKATTEPERRARMLWTMLANGAASLNDGPKRIDEVAEPLDGETLAGSLLDFVRARIGDAPAIARALGGAPGLLARRDGTIGSVGARIARAESLEAVARELVALTRGHTEAEASAGAFERELAVERERLEAERAALGHCIVEIGGRRVTAASHAIALPASPTPQERLAAEDLAAHLERISGEAPPVVGESEIGVRAAILVGDCREAGARLGLDTDPGALGLEGIRIRTAGPNLALSGGKRGVLYAVYTFLEEQLGCRWFTADCTTWPTEGRIAVGELAIEKVPALEYRSTDYPNSRPPEFAVRNKLNGNIQYIPEEWGGKISYAGFVHTFNWLVPPEQHFATHPEYFSEIGGTRRKDYTQLCLTNPEVLAVAIASVRRMIAENPEATIVSVSQNDWGNWCQCPECTQVAEEEGAQSGPLLRFVNAIAEDIERDYPHIIIDTLAYQYTRKPPKITRPRPNVAIRLCSIECEFNRPLDASPMNASFVEDIRGWHAICNRLHIWDYVINYAHSVQPFPNLRVLGPNIRFFINGGVTGIYEEANYYSKGGELAELRTYLMAKLLWDPDADVDRAMDEFLAAYYGPAAAPIREYLDDIHRLAVSDDNFHMPIYVGPTAPFQTPEAIARYAEMFDRAESLVRDDPVRLHRVEVARLPILYTEIARNLEPVYRLGADTLEPGSEQATEDTVGRFARIARAEGMTQVSEGGVGANLENWLAQVGPGAKSRAVVRLAGGGLEAVIVPDYGGKLLSLVRQEDGLELLQVAHRGGGIVLSDGGYEEYSTHAYRSPGWSESYSVVARDEASVTLACDLANGVRIERSYALDPTTSALRIATKLTNASAEPREVGLRMHPCFAIGDPARTLLALGADAPKPLSEWAPDAGERYFSAAEKPAGSWSLVLADRGARLESRFDPAGVEECYLNWSSADSRANLELWAPTATLAPGASVETIHEWRVSGL